MRDAVIRVAAAATGLAIAYFITQHTALFCFKKKVSEDKEEKIEQPEAHDDVDQRNACCMMKNSTHPQVLSGCLDEECDQDLEGASSEWPSSQQHVFVVQDEPFEDPTIQALVESKHRVAFLPNPYTIEDHRLLLSLQPFPCELMKTEDAEHRLSTTVLLLRNPERLAPETASRFENAQWVCIVGSGSFDPEVLKRGVQPRPKWSLQRLGGSGELVEAMAAWAK